MIALALAEPLVIGKIDKHMLSDQTLMELIIANLHPEDKTQFQDNGSKYSDCSRWPGVTLNKAGDIKEIDLSEKTLRPGSLDFRWIPSTVTRVYAYECNLMSTIDLTDLPPKLEEFVVWSNNIEGTACFSHLPDSLGIFVLSNNKFVGPVDLTILPGGLQELHLRENTFNGTLDLSSLPKTLVELDLSRNAFEGSIDLSCLPVTLTSFLVSENQLFGLIDLLTLPKDIRFDSLDLGRNAFEGSIVTRNLSAERILYFNNDRFSGSLRINELPKNVQFFNAQMNQLSGSIELHDLPMCIREIELDHNFTFRNP